MRYFENNLDIIQNSGSARQTAYLMPARAYFAHKHMRTKAE